MSTAMLSQPTVVSMPPALVGPASPAKKRRRRAPATGAAEDCFTCRAKGIKCDRRRPYCGPCLEVGNDCRGYRTQLTWGVGVASRGKLRGLHVPVVNLVDNKNTQKVVKKKAEDKSTSANGNGMKSKRPKSSGRDYDNQRNTGVAKLSIITSYDFVNMEVPSSSSSRASSALSTSTAGTSPALSSISQTSMPSQRLSQVRKSPQANPSAYSPYSASPQQQYHSHLSSQQQQQYQAPVQHYHKSPYSHVSLPPHQPTPSMLLSPMSEYEPSFSSPQHYPMSSGSSTAPLYDMVTGVSSASYHPSASMTVTSSGVSYASMTAPIMHTSSRMMDSDHLHHSHHHQHHHHNGSWNGVGMGNLHHQHVQAGNGNLSDLLYDDEMLGIPQSESSYNSPSYQGAGTSISTSQQSLSVSSGLSSIAAPFPPPPQLANIPSNLRFLIDYYDKTVCASIVAFDGPGNPFREHILPMAFNNGALMEAVYALSTSHLESKRKGTIVFENKSNYPEDSQLGSPVSSSSIRSHSPSSPISPTTTNFNKYRPSPDSHQRLNLSSVVSSAKGSSSAAFNHKNNSINLLNAQLTNPELAKSDSAMATLLILLFFHISETGIGQFKTHLAGVKKLMGMRCVGKETGIWGWMETVFTWLDNMSASVNNREAQLRGGYLDMIFESGDSWDLESLTGCDRDLFMRLASLGRINVLSQTPPKNGSYVSRSYAEEDDGESEPFRDENDGRDEFWLAWNVIKRDLRDWRPTTIYAATPSRHQSTETHSAPKYNPVGFEDTEFSGPRPSMSPPPQSVGSPTRRRPSRAYEAVENNHWLHASNVYRYAAILYIDRLAYPHLPSSHSIFQNTVREVLDHVNCIPNSGLSHRLLWPLFITGTECVVDAHRNMIRERCIEMQRECGFFNKVSGLVVLEKIWSEDITEEEEGYLSDEMFAGARRMGKVSQSIGGRGLRWRKVTGHEDAEYLMV